MATIEEAASESRSCQCGCGQEARLLSGKFSYKVGRYAVFRTILLKCNESGPHVWSLLGKGSWFEDDNRDCWLTLHTWVKEDNLVTRVENPEDSPFPKLFEFSERLLTREEVLSQEGGKEWAFEVHDSLQTEHGDISTFILGLAGV
jgi:hypothetical protein